MTKPNTIIDQIANWLETWTFRFLANEKYLHAEVYQVLKSTKYKIISEYKLGARSRIDFYLSESSIGVEIKIAGSVNQVMRQIHRYNAYDQISGIILITSRAKHTSIPLELNHKPVRIVFIGGIQ